jgi:lysophospholipase L1-like esterase
VVLSPLVFLALLELGVRVSGVSTDLARNKNFKVAVPTWLLADPDWVRTEQRRMETRGPIRAEDVAWFACFEEARFVGIKLKPHLDVYVVNPFNSIEVAKQVTFHLTSNGDGFRGPEFTPPSPSVLRVIAIGDSSTFGWGVDPAYTYEELLARRLEAGGRRAEVFNLGMPGTNTRQGLAMLDHVAAPLQPRVVIASFGANDARLTLRSAEDGMRGDESWLAAAQWALLHLKTFGLARRLIFTWYDPFQAVHRSEATRVTPLVKTVSLADYARNLRRIRGHATVLGARTVVFLSVCTPDDYVAVMRDTAAQMHVPFVDAGQIFREKVGQVRAGQLYPAEMAHYRDLYGTEAMDRFWLFYVTTDGCHPNRVGQSLIADALAGAVTATLDR